MFFVAAVLVYFAFGALSNLWADYQDSPATTYVAVGGFELLAAGLSAAVGAWLLREHERHNG